MRGSTVAKKKEMVQSPIWKRLARQMRNCSEWMLIPLKNYWLNTARSISAEGMPSPRAISSHSSATPAVSEKLV